MSLSKESALLAVVKSAAAFFRCLPFRLTLAIAGSIGWLGYYVSSKKKAIIYANLKTAFGGRYSPSELKALTHGVFVNFAKSFAEVLCFPKIKRLGFERFVQVEHVERVHAALKQGKGIIFLAVHSGNWELASIVGSMTGSAYNIVANEQSKAPQLDELLNEYRRVAGAKVIAPGIATKEIIRALKNNEMVSLVLDQGGKDGLPVKFFGKTASMSTGAVRLALKYGCVLCPVWITRRNDRHTLTFFEGLPAVNTGNLEKDVMDLTQKAVAQVEGRIIQHPDEYMWFYKVFKYTTEKDMVIIDDGRTGHLRQSQAIARSLGKVLNARGKQAKVHIVGIDFRWPIAENIFSLYAWCAQFLPGLRREGMLKYFLTEKSFKALTAVKADFCISCGSKAAGVNYVLSKQHMAKTISILTPGLLSTDSFDLAVLHEHDAAKANPKGQWVATKAAPNLINAPYLKSQVDGLLSRYSHLKGNVRTKFGVLLGGNAKGVVFQDSAIRQLLSQIKEAAGHYNADVLLTTSRRTPVSIDQIIAKEMKNSDRCPLCIIANQNNVPEAVGGILGLCDLVIVSGESISMVSEALTSGKKTIVFSPMGSYGATPRDKYEKFVLKLNDEGYLIASSIKDLSANITQLLSHKIALKSLDDEVRLSKALEGIV